MTAARKEIDDFLSAKRLAIIGVSRNAKDFTRSLFREFRRRGYDAIPVNPAMADCEGVRCYANVQDIEPRVDRALLLTPAAASDRVVRECDAAGVRRIWLYRATGAGAVSTGALKLCQARGIPVVGGECPFMFFHGAQWPHRLHACYRKLLGTYPK
jgi:predicted CoA-binding protein